MNYLFYDYETSGRDRVYDQILQFGAIKTDAEFNQIGEPVEIFCKLRRDVLPSPGAIKVNQIDIDELNSKGLTEFEFAKRVSAILLGDGNQCVVGYNSKSFDNIFTRFLLYRNFHDPYAWSYLNGNTCFDLFDVMSLGYSFDQLSDIQISDENGPSLRLENIAKWNNLEHDDAHNAVSDVKATIQLAQLLREKSPKSLDHALRLRNFEFAKRIITTNERFLYSSSFNGYENKFLSSNMAIDPHPIIAKSIIGWNLKCKPSDILGLSADEIRDQIYSKKELKTTEVGFNEFKLNQSPMVIPFDEKWSGSLVSYDESIANFKSVNDNIVELRKLAREIFNTTIPETDPDADLYVSEYFRQVNTHSAVFATVRANPMAVAETQIRHVSFLRLFRRLRARNFYDELSETEQLQFRKFCIGKFESADDVGWVTRLRFDKEMDGVFAEGNLSEKQERCLYALRKYVDDVSLSDLVSSH